MDIHNLIKWIKSDIDRDGAYDRYPVRFFSIKYESGVSEGLIQLQQCSGAEILDIKNLLPHEDAWISPSSLRHTYEKLYRGWLFGVRKILERRKVHYGHTEPYRIGKSEITPKTKNLFSVFCVIQSD